MFNIASLIPSDSSNEAKLTQEMANDMENRIPMEPKPYQLSGELKEKIQKLKDQETELRANMAGDMAFKDLRQEILKKDEEILNLKQEIERLKQMLNAQFESLLRMSEEATSPASKDSEDSDSEVSEDAKNSEAKDNGSIILDQQEHYEIEQMCSLRALFAGLGVPFGLEQMPIGNEPKGRSLDGYITMPVNREDNLSFEVDSDSEDSEDSDSDDSDVIYDGTLCPDTKMEADKVTSSESESDSEDSDSELLDDEYSQPILVTSSNDVGKKKIKPNFENSEVQTDFKDSEVPKDSEDVTDSDSDFILVKKRKSKHVKEVVDQQPIREADEWFVKMLTEGFDMPKKEKDVEAKTSDLGPDSEEFKKSEDSEDSDSEDSESEDSEDAEDSEEPDVSAKVLANNGKLGYQEINDDMCLFFIIFSLTFLITFLVVFLVNYIGQ